MRSLIRPILPLLAAVVAAMPAHDASAQRVDPNRVFDITLDVNGQVMSATIRDGGMFRLTLQGTDEYRLVPVVSAPDGRTVTMAVYRGTAGQPSTSRIVERVELAVGRPATLRTNADFTLVVDRIRSSPPQRQASVPVPQSISFAASTSWRRAVQSDRCCVCCGGACACGVRMGCGSCCMAGCCNVQVASNPGTGGDDARRSTLPATYLGGSACERPFPAAAATARIAVR